MTDEVRRIYLAKECQVYQQLEQANYSSCRRRLAPRMHNIRVNKLHLTNVPAWLHSEDEVIEYSALRPPTGHAASLSSSVVVPPPPLQRHHHRRCP